MTERESLREFRCLDGEGDVCGECEDCNPTASALLVAFRRPRSYTPEFEQHASPEAIQAHIDAARKRQAETQNELGWLEGLYLRRIQERRV